MKDEQDLLKQLKNLPDGAQAPDRWGNIQQQIESERLDIKTASVKTKPWWAMAVAASVLLIAVISSQFFTGGNGLAVNNKAQVSNKVTAEQVETIHPAYRLTINSLQQANAYYYAKLGNKVLAKEVQLSPQTWTSLSSLRQAQQQYRAALVKKPGDSRIQERLFWLYQKERDLLRQIVIV